MVTDVSSEGITKIVKFGGEKPNGENSELSLEKNKELIERNEELYIQGLFLHNAVEKFLGSQCGKSLIDKKHNPASLPGMIPTRGNTNSNPTTFLLYKGKELPNAIGEVIKDLEGITYVPNNNYKLDYINQVNNSCNGREPGV
ncbi:hypothetical protein [Wolbachia endosymbiont of Wuchereria bancrofti]|uniref:hypothetical protein n=1 Tax=Wolbachia endosymbiont of Wuchereria bancrofti TaxID=96496 RepID=UPI000B4D77F6|nr:hypothetical protein [Wolbachia endosymbiont of Wuchereria bancrofti]